MPAPTGESGGEAWPPRALQAGHWQLSAAVELLDGFVPAGLVEQALVACAGEGEVSAVWGRGLLLGTRRRRLGQLTLRTGQFISKTREPEFALRFELRLSRG